MSGHPCSHPNSTTRRLQLAAGQTTARPLPILRGWARAAGQGL